MIVPFYLTVKALPFLLTKTINMKKLLPLLFLLCGGHLCFAATFNITTPGFFYSPATTTVNVGDIVNIQASSLHPCTEVAQATWDLNENTPASGALFQHQTSTVVVTITAGMAGTTIFFVCDNHVASDGMKGKIVVNVATGLEENVKRDFNFTVYPNPVKNNAALNISLKKNDYVDLKIFSINGKLVSNYLQQKMNAGEYTLPFDAARLETGVYIMQLKTSQGVLRKQIMVTR